MRKFFIIISKIFFPIRKGFSLIGGLFSLISQIFFFMGNVFSIISQNFSIRKIFSIIKSSIIHMEYIPEDVIKTKNIKLGLRNEDGSGVVVGITAKGSVLGYVYESDESNPTIKVKKPAEGRLFYCGIDVKDIINALVAENRFGFEETVFLLLAEQLPTKEELEMFSEDMRKRRKLSSQELSIIIGESNHSGCIQLLHNAVSHLGRCDETADSANITDIMLQCINLIAKCPNIVAKSHNVLRFLSDGDLLFLRPKEDLSTAENFLYMLKGTVPDREDALMLDKILILHAEHGGGNNSTFTVRTISSSGANTYMAIAAGIASLSGYFMSRATEVVPDMIDSIISKKSKYKNITDANIREYLKEYINIQRKQKPYSSTGFEHAIPGFGHPIYTISDPRSVILKDLVYSFAKKKGFEKEYAIYERIERIAVKLLSSKNSFPVCSNVDYYTALVYKMLDIPKELFTSIFAMSRIVGWSAHRIEQLKYTKIIRPAYLSTHEEENQFISIENR